MGGKKIYQLNMNIFFLLACKYAPTAIGASVCSIFLNIFSLTALRLERLTNDLIKICLCANQLDSSAACKIASDETAEIARLQRAIIECVYFAHKTLLLTVLLNK